MDMVEIFLKSPHKSRLWLSFHSQNWSLHNFSLVCEKLSPCQNGGTCVTLRSGLGYKCICPKILDGIYKGLPSHIGANCEQQLIIKTSKRPQESEDLKTQCKSYFTGEPIPGLDDTIKMKFQINAATEYLWKNEHLTYK